MRSVLFINGPIQGERRDVHEHALAYQTIRYDHTSIFNFTAVEITYTIIPFVIGSQQDSVCIWVAYTDCEPSFREIMCMLLREDVLRHSVWSR